MAWKIPLAGCVLALSLNAGYSAPAYAHRDDERHDSGGHAVDWRGEPSSEAAAQRAQSRHGGRVLSVRPQAGDNRSYRVRLLSKGHVWEEQIGPDD